MKVTVDRSRWLRGRNSVLRDKYGHMCVLGFHCMQVGVPAECLLGLSKPEQVAGNCPNDAAKLKSARLILKRWTARGSWEMSAFAAEAMAINDRDNILGADGRFMDREAALQELYRKYGHELEFI